MGTQARSRTLGSGSDTLLQVIAIKPWQPMLFSLDWGYGWAKGTAVSWRT